jgi:hypothetical protein
MTLPGPTVWQVLRDVWRHPLRHFVKQWNWKSAIVSAVSRATLFLLVNLPAGVDAGLHAMQTELLFRAVVSGALGSLTQSFSRARPARTAALVALLLLPALGHTAEFLVHRQAGTARLGASVLVSIAFSVITTAFNLFAMRRGALIVGAGGQSLWADARRLPRLVIGFGLALLRPFTGAKRSATRPCPTPPCI